MRRLTRTECLQWLSMNGFAHEADGHHFFVTSEEVTGADIVQPENSRAVAIMAAAIAAALKSGQEALLFITEWGVWPSEEMWPLVDHALIGYGDPRPFGDAPGFVFTPQESDDLTVFVRLSLICGWSGAALSRSAPLGFSFTDDNWVGVFGRSNSLVQDFVQQVWPKEPDKVLWQGVIVGGKAEE